ncbi:UDP-N-acetylmuramoylalanine--D-glutamate ligase [Thiosulfatimonas sediminis]|uniref:UDP-N-acetylmuramoylalanine--D-glutamate ligase n=1 Tax=Thiosulfatimonas sediminis TaxID=2675054 RepID=A0A6F8PX24_9GAMM|nr:UDP-N-acetylmuramoyl-L-alanine--D-glutamate ligase [Thiosulfatimonas sediminis]BBP46554.1 UDP-N-acetylmuramoylalanine--D-glutamate ligase [Thiosulfatimonas sediminis]
MIMVAGLGITGQSVLRFLQTQQERCYAFDTRADFDIRPLRLQFPQVQFACGELPKRWREQVKTLVLSPGIDQREPWVQQLIKQGVEVIGDIELFARAVGVPVVAITGSNGKSTVTTLIGEALKTAGYEVAVAGNIGLPALDALLDERDYEVYVLELSSFQLETTYSLHSISATVLNISEDHMDRYDHMAAYTQAKCKVFDDTELAVLPTDLNLTGLGAVRQIRFGIEPPQSEHDYGLMEREGQVYLAKGAQPLVNCAQMLLQGAHHQLNALAMMALCEPFEVSKQVFSQVLTNFSGLPHRTQLVTEVNSVQWINDSKGTNVGATLTALQTFGPQIDGKIVLLAGGVSKDADFSSLLPTVQAYCSVTILFGRDREIIAQALREHCDVCLVETLAEAVAMAASRVQSGDCVLFSPACASFDQFKNYAQRGEIFKEIVQQQFASPGVSGDAESSHRIAEHTRN